MAWQVRLGSVKLASSASSVCAREGRRVKKSQMKDFEEDAEHDKRGGDDQMLHGRAGLAPWHPHGYFERRGVGMDFKTCEARHDG